MNVFIIDDHHDTVETLKMALELEGFSVQSFTDFYEAYKLVTLRVPCIALVDVHVPGEMTILEFCNEIRKNHPTLPIIVISGDYQARTYADRLQALFMLKPFEISDLVEQVKRVCPKAKDRRD